jgi:malonate transporter and related proteins
MHAISSALIPVMLLIFMGWGLRQQNIIREQDWAGLEVVGYKIFFPAIIFTTLASANLADVAALEVSAVLIGCVLFAALLLFGLRPLLARRFGIDGPAFTSLLQGSTRWNSFLALAIAQSLHGRHGVAIIAVALVAMTPILNILAVTALAHYGTTGNSPPLSLTRLLFLNPLIWSSLAGLAANPFQSLIPISFMVSLDMLGKAAFAAGLLVVGAGLNLRALARLRFVHIASIVFKLILFPLYVLAGARLIGIDGIDLAALVIAASVPTAGASYILARQMGGDAPLMAELITLQTLVSFLTLPFVILWSGS